MPWRLLQAAQPGSQGLDKLLDRLPAWVAIPLICIVILSTFGKPVLNWLKDIYAGIRDNRTIREELEGQKKEITRLGQAVQKCEDEREDLDKIRASQDVVIDDYKKLLRGILESNDLDELKGVIRAFTED